MKKGGDTEKNLGEARAIRSKMVKDKKIAKFSMGELRNVNPNWRKIKVLGVTMHYGFVNFITLSLQRISYKIYKRTKRKHLLKALENVLEDSVKKP